MEKKSRISRLLLTSLIAFLLLTGTPGIQAQNRNKQDSDKQALTELFKQMVNAQTNFDTSTLEKIYAPDFIEISPAGEVDPREETIGFYKPEANPDRDKMKAIVTSDEFSIRTYDNFAVVIARITFAQTGSESSARPPFSLRVTLVCRKEKGSWKINSAQYTGIRPPRPQPVK
ncbi:MAG TPA: nuclear transport factor 2 family protein [Pyrinomonadaceae bacterium]|nr:nuclear transport factor 2 family protein [Pyrinomonadaceae bacterium]